MSRNLLIPDLDETLIHACLAPLELAPDFRFDRYYVYKRPGVEQFLLNVSQWRGL